MHPALILSRGVADAGLLSAFGALLFRAGFAPGAARTAAASVALTLAALAAWTLLLGIDLGGSPAGATTVLLRTLFGHLLLAQAALLLAALLLTRRAPWSATAAAALALALEAAHGHAWAMGGPSPLFASVTLHLLAAGAWLGGLVPLLLCVRTAPASAAAAVARRFGRLGTACVVVMAATALYQSWVLMGPLPDWSTFTYGRLGLLKAGLFAVLLAFAAVNRFRLVPALARPGRPALGASIAAETAIGLLVVLAAGWLASSAPAMDM